MESLAHIDSYVSIAMAEPEYVVKLKAGINAWNQWRVDNPEISPDLSDMDLRGFKDVPLFSLIPYFPPTRCKTRLLIPEVTLSGVKNRTDRQIPHRICPYCLGKCLNRQASTIDNN